MGCQVSNIVDEVLSIKDLVSTDFQNRIIEKMSGENSFPWYTIDRIGHKDFFEKDETNIYTDTNVSDFGGLYHMVVDDGVPRSDDAYFFTSILDSYCTALNKRISKIHRIRIRYTHPVPNHTFAKYAAPHIDFNSEEDFTTLVYYVDNSDGDTILFSKKHVIGQKYDPVIKEPLTEVYRHTPTKGEALVFSGHRYHAGNYPINYGRRVVINFDFVEHEA